MDPDKLVAFAADNQSFIITPKKSEVILLPAGYIYVHVAMHAQYFRWSTMSDVNDGVIQAKRHMRTHYKRIPRRDETNILPSLDQNFAAGGGAKMCQVP